MNKCIILRGHTSQETAYLVDDYPYGFRLRCKIRYWLDYKKGFGFRLVSQTTNPKAAYQPMPGNEAGIVSEVWNKPKASTYSSGPAFLYLDEHGYIRWTAFGHPASHVGDYFVDFKSKWAGQLTEEDLKALEAYEKISRKFNPESWAVWDANHSHVAQPAGSKPLVPGGEFLSAGGEAIGAD